MRSLGLGGAPPSLGGARPSLGGLLGLETSLSLEALPEREQAFDALVPHLCPSKETLYSAEGTSGTALLAVDAWLELWNFGESTPEADWITPSSWLAE